MEFNLQKINSLEFVFPSGENKKKKKTPLASGVMKVLAWVASPFHGGCSFLQLAQEERIESGKTSEKLPTRHPVGRGREGERYDD